MQLKQASGHHDEICHHLVLPDKLVQSHDHIGHFGILAGGEFFVQLRGGWTPVPGVIEGGDLGFGGLAGFVFEQDVVGPVRIEGCER